MPDIKKYSIEWNGAPLTIEFNRFAGQANGSCTVQYGDTLVLATVVMSPEAREDMNYFPLTVEFQESLSAAGKISGSRFIKREGRPSDKATLSARLIDRSIRPYFNESIRNEIQVIVTVLAYNEKYDPDVCGLIGASAALLVSDIPWNGPMAGCTVSVKEGQNHLNAGQEFSAASDLNIFVAGRNMETAMLEADGREATEDVTYNAIEFGLQQMEPVNQLLEKITKEIGKEKHAFTIPESTAEDQAEIKKGQAAGQAYFKKEGAKLFGLQTKQEYRVAHDAAVKELTEQFTEEETVAAQAAVKELEQRFADEMIRRMFEDNKRVDDRGLDEIRPLQAEAGLIPRVHGSGMFMRGDTQVLSIVTLSSPSNEQILDTMRDDAKLRYFHHYSFPPYSVGETKPMRGPGRREIGHGALADKAIVPLLPNKIDFPYTIRVVSNVMSSNGSSSQGSVCGSSLALMDAGVPIKRAAAGIAMGIVFQNPNSKDEYKILTDLKDVEDYERSMDFKVAGTEQGITAIQLDMKFDGLTLAMVRETLDKAKAARLEILKTMTAVIAEPRAELSPFAPRIEIMHIDPERIGELIGPGGKVINGIIEQTGVAIDIEDDGSVFITSTDGPAMAKAKQIIEELFKEILPGETYEGKVVKIVQNRDTGNEIGAIVQLTSNQDGMVHISQIANERVAKVSDVLKVGDTVKVKVLEVDKRTGRISLSRKALLNARSGGLSSL